MDIKDYMQTLGSNAKHAGRVLSRTESGQKNRALLAIADAIDHSRSVLASENQKDLAAGLANGLPAAALDRLALTPKAIDAMIEGLKQVAALLTRSAKSPI